MNPTGPLAYFITWTCYGTWLPGDERGWIKWSSGDKLPQPILAEWCRNQMTEEAVFLSNQQRNIVNHVIEEHCSIRKWHLFAVNCRSNHCHVVVYAGSHQGEIVREQLKSWTTRRLNESIEIEHRQSRDKWWTKKGSVRYLFDEISLQAAIQYTLEAQDRGGSSCQK